MRAARLVHDGERGSAALGALAVLILVAAFAAAAYLPLASGIRAAARAAANRCMLFIAIVSTAI